MKKLGAIQDWGTQFGTKSAREMSGTIGAPEIGADLPEGVKGQGELRMSAQDLTLQKALMSNNIQQQNVANRELGMQIREAQMQGNQARSDQLMEIKNSTLHLEEERMQEIGRASCRERV